MVRRSHVVPGSIACCPWWTLGGGALVAAAAVTLSGAPLRQSHGAELDDRASRGVEVFSAESESVRETEDPAVGDDDERAGTPLPLTSPPRIVPTQESIDGRPAPSARATSFSALRPASDSTGLDGSAPLPDAR